MTPGPTSRARTQRRTERGAFAVSIAIVGFLGAMSAPALAATSPTTVAPTVTTQAAVAPTSLTISKPQTGDTVVNSRLEIIGTAPAAVLVSVTIVDTDRGRSAIAHQHDGGVDGSVTSDAGGHWVFVPQVKVTPGEFEVHASYSTPDGEAVASAAIPFVVINQSGESALPSSGLKRNIAIAVLLLVVGGVVVFRKRRQSRHADDPQEPPARAKPRLLTRYRQEAERFRRDREWPASYPESSAHAAPEPARAPQRVSAPHIGWLPETGRHDETCQCSNDARAAEPVPYREVEPHRESRPLFMNTTAGREYQDGQARKMHDMDDQMKRIEQSLAETAEALERSNATIAGLRHQISDELDGNPAASTNGRTRPRPPQAASTTPGRPDSS